MDGTLVPLAYVDIPICRHEIGAFPRSQVLVPISVVFIAVPIDFNTIALFDVVFRGFPLVPFSSLIFYDGLFLFSQLQRFFSEIKRK
jgi:hypothetical protein